MKPKPIQFYLLIFILGSLFFTGCKKQNDPEDPVITVETPLEYQFFNVFDTIHVKATVTSEDELTGLQVSLVDEKLIPVLATYTISTNTYQTHTWKIDQYIPIDAIQLESGNYFLWIRASTALTTKSKYLMVRIVEVKKALKKILLLTRSNLNTTSLFSLDSAMSMDHLYDFPQDIAQATIDPVNGLLFISGRNTGMLTAFKLDSNRILWQKSGLGTAELPYYQDIRLEGTLLVVSSSDGKLTGYDPSGKISFYKDFGFIQYPVRNCIVGNLIITAVEQKNGPLRYLNNYFYPSGAYQSGIQIPFKVVSILQVAEDKLLVTGNQDETGIIRYYNPKDPGLWTPCLFPGGTIKKVINGHNESNFLLTRQTVYWFLTASNTLTSFASGQGFVDIAYDNLTDHLIVADHNTLNFYSYPQAGLINSITVPDSLKACLLWYNK